LSSDITALVEAALGEGEEAGVSAMLQCLAERFNSFGCAILELGPKPELGAVPPKGHLFVQASWFPSGRIFAICDLPVADSASGTVLLRQQGQLFDDIQRQGGAGKDNRFLRENQIRQMLSVPISFLDGGRGVVNLYRREDESVFSRSDQTRLEAVTRVIPHLYRGIRNKESLALIRRVHDLLRDAEEGAASAPMTRSEMQGVLEGICRSVAERFHCIEVSMILEDPTDGGGVFRIMATTWPEGCERTEYVASNDCGMTGWVLANRRPLRILDREHEHLVDFEDHPGLHLTPVDKLKQQLCERLGREDDLPPFTYMACPILAAGKTLGAIRCSVTEQSPFYFTERDLGLLEIVGTHVSQFWHGWVSRRDLFVDSLAFRTLIEIIRKLNTSVQDQLVTQDRDGRQILDHALDELRRGITGAESITVRLESGGTDDESGGKGRASPPQPMMAGREVLGYLRVESKQDTDLTRHEVTVAQLLQSQLDLCRHLSESIEALERTRNENAQILNDFSHQLRGPMIQAENKVTSLARRRPDDRDLQVLRGLCKKAKRVSMRMGLFESLATGTPIRAGRSRLAPAAFTRTLIEAAVDNRLMVPRYRNIDFWVDVESIERLGSLDNYRVDYDLVEQALNNVLDNAGKYSHDNTTVRIVASWMERNLRISVFDTGLRLQEGETESCKTRGWQSDAARSVKGEGRGLGLWVVDHIMRAHGGALAIRPTDDNGETEVYLEFPEGR